MCLRLRCGVFPGLVSRSDGTQAVRRTNATYYAFAVINYFIGHRLLNLAHFQQLIEKILVSYFTGY